MPIHSHTFVEYYNGLAGYGYDRESNEKTLAYYLQKFSDDEHIKLIAGRMSDQDMEGLYDMLCGLLKKYLDEEEYHRVFLKE